jgi:hypothetical protein
MTDTQEDNQKRTKIREMKGNFFHEWEYYISFIRNKKHSFDCIGKNCKSWLPVPIPKNLFWMGNKKTRWYYLIDQNKNLQTNRIYDNTCESIIFSSYDFILSECQLWNEALFEEYFLKCSNFWNLFFIISFSKSPKNIFQSRLYKNKCLFLSAFFWFTFLWT